MARMPYPPIGLWLRGYGKNAIPSYWFMVAWVWQGCHTLLLVCGCVGMARMPYPPIGLWLRGYGKDAIPSYYYS